MRVGALACLPGPVRTERGEITVVPRNLRSLTTMCERKIFIISFYSQGNQGRSYTELGCSSGVGHSPRAFLRSLVSFCSVFACLSDAAITTNISDQELGFIGSLTEFIITAATHLRERLGGCFLEESS